MLDPIRRDANTPSIGTALISVIVHATGELEFGLSPRDGEYGKYVVGKITVPAQDPVPYRCRVGACVQFRQLTGEPLGAPTPISELRIVTQERKGGGLRYLIGPESLRGVEGLILRAPALPIKAPATSKFERATTDRPAFDALKTPHVSREVKPAETKLTTAPQKPSPVTARSGMLAVDAEVEKTLREALMKENSDLHDKIRRSNHTGAVKTWIDGYFEVAQARLKTSTTPMAHMAQVFLNPAYLNLKHADPGKAAETVALVAAFFDVLSRTAPGPLKKFSRELLEKFQGEAKSEQDQTVLGKRAPTPAELLAKLEDPKSNNAVLEAVHRQLFAVIGRGIHATRRIQTETGKRESLKTLEAVLNASQRSKAYKSMSVEERGRFDAEVARERGRIDSLRRSTNLGR